MTTHRTSRRARALLAILALTAGSVAISTRAADDAATKSPAAATPAASQPARSKEAITADLNAAGADLRKLIQANGPKTFTDEKLRKEVAPKAIPVMKKFIAAFDELAAQDPMARTQTASVHGQFLSMMTALGDADAEKQLTKLAEGTGDDVLQSKAALIVAKWWKNSTNADEQKKLLDQATELLKANATNDSLAMTIVEMSNTGAANDDLRKAAEEAVIANAKGQRGQMVVEQLKAAQKLKGMENQPLTIAGVKNDGQQFTTADWKGKVILVDFWATWCGPCREELPRVKKAYADFHDKGLEVLGVSCDRDPAALKAFLAENKDMPWPQLFDEKTPGWHPIATSYGINGIPTMFLIDKKGVCRTVEARENFEELIPKMLAE